MFGKDAFIAGLKASGSVPEDLGDNRVAFPYTIRDGRFKEKTIKIGVEVPTDFPVTCPSGPHISPRLIPLNPNGQGNDRATESAQFGTDWQYLSRPFVDNAEGWNRTSKDVNAYLRHLKRIMEEL